MAASYGDADIDEFSWVNDDRLVYSVTDTTRGGGDQRWWPGLFSVRRDGSEPRPLVKIDRPFVTGVRRIGPEPLDVHHALLHVPRGSGDEVIVGEWRYDSSRELDTVNAKRLNVVTGRTTTLSVGAPAHVRRWLFDPRRSKPTSACPAASTA